MLVFFQNLFRSLQSEWKKKKWSYDHFAWQTCYLFYYIRLFKVYNHVVFIISYDNSESRLMAVPWFRMQIFKLADVLFLLLRKFAAYNEVIINMRLLATKVMSSRSSFVCRPLTLTMPNFKNEIIQLTFYGTFHYHF